MFPTTTLNAHYSTQPYLKVINNVDMLTIYLSLTGFPSKKFGFNFWYTIQMMGQLTFTDKCTLNLLKTYPIFNNFEKF